MTFSYMKRVNFGQDQGGLKSNIKLLKIHITRVRIDFYISKTLFSDMNSFGQTDVVTVTPGTEIELRISTVNIENLKTEDTNCIEDDKYSLTQCLKKYALTKTKERSRKI